MNLVQTAKDGMSKVRTYWKTPMAGRYMTFREIAAYSGGGIGAYFLITIGTACILGASNVLLTSTLGVDATDMYIMYVIAVLANIPLTGIRANIIDNTRNKAGKYRPYIVTMAIPTAIICILVSVQQAGIYRRRGYAVRGKLCVHSQMRRNHGAEFVPALFLLFLLRCL